MSWTVIRLEWRRMRRSLLVLLLLFWGLSLLGLFSGWQESQRHRDNAHLLQTQHQQWLQTQQQKTLKREQSLRADGLPLQPDKRSFRNPAWLAQQGTPALLALGPLAWASTGQSPLLPQSVTVSLKDPALLETQDNLQHPLQLASGQVDLVFVLVYILPLLLIAISFDLTASEQASGTLRLLLVQGGSLVPLLLAKLLARVLVLLGLLLGLSLLVWVWLHFTGQALDLTRWGLSLLAVLVYGCFWILLAAALNARRLPAAQIAAGLATCWLLWTWLIPAASQQSLQTFFPVPSRLEYIQSYREASESARQQSSQLLGAYLEDHPELAGGADNRYALLQLSKEQALAQAVGPVLQAYATQLQQQQRWARGLQYLSPVSLLEQSLMQLAGSDLSRYQDFRQQVATFQGQWQGFFLPLIQQGQAVNSVDFARFPAFVYQEPKPLTHGLWLQLGFLCGLAGVLLLWVLAAYRRYAVIAAESPLNQRQGSSN